MAKHAAAIETVFPLLRGLFRISPKLSCISQPQISPLIFRRLFPISPNLLRSPPAANLSQKFSQANFFTASKSSPISSRSWTSLSFPQRFPFTDRGCGVGAASQRSLFLAIPAVVARSRMCFRLTVSLFVATCRSRSAIGRHFGAASQRLSALFSCCCLPSKQGPDGPVLSPRPSKTCS